MEIRSVTDVVLFVSSCLTLKDALIEAVSKRADLYGANLYGANLREANLRGADLRGANLYEANLYGADLRGANLRGADLRGANLYGANLREANLRGADLRGANLYGADLRGANLYEANLYGANLRGADLYGADLYGANLRGANLRGAKNAELSIAQMQFIPETGSFEAWKMCRNRVIVKLLIPTEAKRSHGTERKCRASEVVVLGVFGASEGISMHDGKTVYRQGERVIADAFDEDRWNTCGNGIHFYITRLEAENYT